MPQCPQCHNDFIITEEENELRHKIESNFEAGPVPPPTHCPDCRMQRRMVRRNERNLYYRPCSKTGATILSMYAPDVPFPVYEREAWWADDWDALEYGKPFDFNRPFFEQFKELQDRVPRPPLQALKSENSDYCNFTGYSKDCYLSHCSYRSESLLYCYWAMECKDCVDCNYIFQCQQCFECTDCNHCYNCRKCNLSHNCVDSTYLYDCRGCSNCFGCVGLRQKSYCLFNEQLSKEEYERRVSAFDLNNPEHITFIEQKIQELKQTHPHRDSIQDKTENCTGDYIFESKNCKQSYQMYRSQDCLYVQDAEVKDCLDGYHPGWGEVLYEVYSVVGQKNTACSSQSWDGGSDNFYCDSCYSNSHCFGCVGLRRKQYCILNRQYSKEEYQKLLPKIVEHMKKTKEWGEFFPIELSTFAYNESMAQQYYPLSKDEVLKRGWQWREALPFTKGKETISWKKIGSTPQDIPDSITQEVLACVKCERNYRVIQKEIDFYKSRNTAVPQHCPECRYDVRMTMRNPRKLWERPCSTCQKSIQTTYAPNRSERVVCESCYLKEIY